MKKKPAPGIPAGKWPDRFRDAKYLPKKTGNPHSGDPAQDWEAVFRAIGTPAFILAPDHTILAANNVTCRITRKTETELRGKKCWEIFHGCNAAGPPDGCPLEQMRISGSHATAEIEVSLDGGWYLVSCTPLFDPDGAVSSIIHIATDITEKKKAEQMLQESQEKYRLLAETSPEMIYYIDTGGYVKYVNEAAARQFHASPDNLVGKHLTLLFPPRAAQAHLESLRKVAAARQMLFHEIVEEFPSGNVYIEVRLAPVINSQDQVIGVLGFSSDITPRKQAEEQREHLIADLARKNAELDRFTYTVSHDLKSPLLAIRAFLPLLEEDLNAGNFGQVKTDIARISESAVKLEDLITTLLTLSRSGRSVNLPVPVPFTDLAREAAGLLEPALQERGVILRIPENMPVVYGDRVRLLQVMTNLLDNAAKFMGDQKEPEVETGVGTGTGSPVFFVQDNGMGIQKENLPKVFGLFEHFNPEIPGTGIGLATVKRIIEAHGGRIWAESAGAGKGTIFRFTLPVAGNQSTDNNNTSKIKE